MAYDFQLYIEFFTPSIVMRFFNEVILPGGGDSYEISKEDGAYLLQSRYATALEKERIHALTGSDLRTQVACSIKRPDVVSAADIVSGLVDRLVYDISRDFLIADGQGEIIIMRRDYDLTLGEGMEERFNLDIAERSYDVRRLPLLET